MSAEGDHVRALVTSVVDATNAGEVAAAVLAHAVVVEQQGVATGQAIAEGLDRVAGMLAQIRDELTALTYSRTGDGR
jgi:hypothetical protein